MYYIWKHEVDDSTIFFSCGIEQFPGWEYVPWNLGKPITQKLPEILNYYTDSKLIPKDFPLTASGFDFLVSKKIADILKRLNVKGIDYYTSQIVRPNGEIIKNYFTLNFMIFLDCIDLEKSNYRIWKLAGKDVNIYIKLILKYYEIPEDILAFRLAKKRTLLVVKEVIKQEFDKENVTGVDLIPIEEFSEK